LTVAEREELLGQIMSGSKVLLERLDVNGTTQKQVQQLSSSAIEYNEDDSVCLTLSNGNQICLIPDSTDCSTSRRHLQRQTEEEESIELPFTGFGIKGVRILP
jgi:hypothetical protein